LRLFISTRYIPFFIFHFFYLRNRQRMGTVLHNTATRSRIVYSRTKTIQAIHRWGTLTALKIWPSAHKFKHRHTLASGHHDIIKFIISWWPQLTDTLCILFLPENRLHHSSKYFIPIKIWIYYKIRSLTNMYDFKIVLYIIIIHL